MAANGCLKGLSALFLVRREGKGVLSQSLASCSKGGKRKKENE